VRTQKRKLKNSIVYKMFLDPVGTEDKEKSTIDKLIIMFYKIKKKEFQIFKEEF